MLSGSRLFFMRYKRKGEEKAYRLLYALGTQGLAASTSWP